MANNAPEPGQEMRGLRRDLVDADDRKIRQIVAVLDEVADPRVNQGILDPIRSRLASLKPVRQMRFTRLLWIPIDPLIVPPRDWRPGDPSVPRTVLSTISRIVRPALGSEAASIEAMIAGARTDAARVITAAGERLWPRAAEILASAATPPDWLETGLRAGTFPDLAQAIAAVFGCAVRLRSLGREEAIGATEPDAQEVNEILLRMTNERSEAGRAMIARLILVQSPHAAPLLRQLVSSVRNNAEKTALIQAVSSGMDEVLTDMEDGSGITGEIARGGLAEAGTGVRRILTLLSELEQDGAAAKHRPRLKAIREKLDQACRARFADGLKEGLVTPLAVAAGPMDGADQTKLETCARDLRTLETAARKVGGADSYDRLLLAAGNAVKAAAAAGHLTGVRKLRLIEILAGTEAAEALYQKEMMLG